MSTTPAPCWRGEVYAPVCLLKCGFAVDIIKAFTISEIWLADNSGCFFAKYSLTNAATPAIWGAAILVPLILP